MNKILQECVIVDARRTPMGNKKSPLCKLDPRDLVSTVIQAILKDNSIPSKWIDDQDMGCAFPEANQGMNIARQTTILASDSITIPGVTTNRFCGSSMQSVHNHSRAIETGDFQCTIAAGVENMIQIEMGGFNPSFHPKLNGRQTYIGMGETAEILAQKGNISREDQEAFAINSHLKALRAQEQGKFQKEIVPVKVDEEIIDRDNHPQKPNLEKIKKLKPAFDKNGTVTAATSSPISVGAAALLLSSREFAKKNGLKIRAIIRGRGLWACEPEEMGKGPIGAVDDLLKKTGVSINDIDVMELNEAFAAQSLYCVNTAGWNPEKINLWGGAIALGHPLGASGARILVTLLHVMEDNGYQRGIAAMCIGGGQGIATLIEIPK